jgi:hypothetical protein
VCVGGWVCLCGVAHHEVRLVGAPVDARDCMCVARDDVPQL